jgi:hypothetical protein
LRGGGQGPWSLRDWTIETSLTPEGQQLKAILPSLDTPKRARSVRQALLDGRLFKFGAENTEVIKWARLDPDPLASPPDFMTEIDLQEIITDTRAAAGPLFVKARIDAETEARKLLNDNIGSMTPALASQLGKSLNRHYWGTGVRHNRFLPGFSEPLIKQMVSNLDHFNQKRRSVSKNDTTRWSSTRVRTSNLSGSPPSSSFSTIQTKVDVRLSR